MENNKYIYNKAHHLNYIDAPNNMKEDVRNDYRSLIENIKELCEKYRYSVRNVNEEDKYHIYNYYIQIINHRIDICNNLISQDWAYNKPFEKGVYVDHRYNKCHRVLI